MWELLALIALVAIIFGITLQQAFWWIIAAGAAFCAIVWAFTSKTGKTFLKWAGIITCCILGGLLIYDGIYKNSSDQETYDKDVYSCQNDEWRYEMAKVYRADNTFSHYNKDVLDTIYNECMQKANDNSKARKTWWLYEVIGGVLIICLPLMDSKNEKQQPKKYSAA